MGLYKGDGSVSLLDHVGGCLEVTKVSGNFPADATTQASPLITQAEAASHRTSMVSDMGYWDVCALADGQIDGQGHGSQIENSQQSGYNCAFTCKPSTPAPELIDSKVFRGNYMGAPPPPRRRPRH